MLTLAPLPAWRGLLRALVRPSPAETELARPWCREGDLAGWLSRSAWSLALIALWRKRHARDSPITVWIPDFFCNSSLMALRATGAKLVFYSLTDKMAPDIAACKVRLDAEPPDLFLLVHYFGQSIPAASTREFCARKGAWLIEDAAHVLQPVGDIGTFGDFVLYSPHKHLPIPEGAVLVVRPNGPGKFGADELASFGQPGSWPDQLRDLQQELGCTSSPVRATAWLIKRMLQKLGVRPLHRSATPYPEPANHALADPARLDAPLHGGLARRLSADLICDLVAVARRRQRHQLLWDTLLLDNEVARPASMSPAERPTNREWTPYLAAYHVDLPAAETIYLRYLRQCLPVTTWPDLPPEVVADPGRHSKAWCLRHSRLYLPVHGSLEMRRMLDRCRLPESARQNQQGLTLVWDQATRQQWQGWFEQAGRSSLMQSWDYGAAKSGPAGWSARRGVFYLHNEPLALVQLLQKRMAGVLRIARINRGPLCLRELLPQEQRAIWKELARLGGIRHGRVLAVAPEADLSGSSLALFAELGFRQFSPRAWESVWIDLGLELSLLRKRLDGKWRNMLAFSEKAGLQVEIGSDAQLFDWMLARYQELMLESNFTGPPISFLLALRKHFDNGSPLLILRAVTEGEAVAGICLIPHGATATYLLGWNGQKGRNLKANQYLLWQAIVHLKQRGVRWLDLGGISEEHTPGVTAFKLGLNGERYELVGEYWKW
jgi:hypothetical protein